MDNSTRVIPVSSKKALEFFYDGLRYLTPELHGTHVLYPACLLADLAQTSCASTSGPVVPNSFDLVFDQYIDPKSLIAQQVLHSLELSEAAGRDCFVLTGFFRKQAQWRRRHQHNIAWYMNYGEKFFGRAATLTTNTSKKNTLCSMSENFQRLSDASSELAEHLAYQRYLLSIDISP